MTSIRQERDHARRMAAAPLTGEYERHLWTQLADEYDAYLARPTDDPDDDEARIPTADDVPLA